MISCVTNSGNCYISEASPKPLFDKFRKGLKVFPINAHPKYAVKCKFNPESTFLATSAGDRKAKLWSTCGSYSLRHVSLTFTPTVTGTVWYLSLVSQEFTAKKKCWMWDLAFSKDSIYLFTASSDGVPRLWSIADQEVITEFVRFGHGRGVNCLAFVHPKGKNV